MTTVRWRHRTRWYAKLVRHAIGLGLASGGVYTYDHSEIRWRGKRCSFLYWPRPKWRCVLRYHHWPSDWPVAFSMCGRCVPWPCCGSVRREHAPGCGEAVTWPT